LSDEPKFNKNITYFSVYVNTKLTKCNFLIQNHCIYKHIIITYSKSGVVTSEEMCC